jgi:hypothetical protein
MREKRIAVEAKNETTKAAINLCSQQQQQQQQQHQQQINSGSSVDKNNNVNEYETAEYEITIDAINRNRAKQLDNQSILNNELNGGDGGDYGNMCQQTSVVTTTAKLLHSNNNNQDKGNFYETILMNTANLTKMNDYQDVDTYIAAASCVEATTENLTSTNNLNYNNNSSNNNNNNYVNCQNNINSNNYQNQYQYDDDIFIQSPSQKEKSNATTVKLRARSSSSCQPINNNKVPQTLISCLDELQHGGNLISWKIAGQGENLTVKVTWNHENQKSSKYLIRDNNNNGTTSAAKVNVNVNTNPNNLSETINSQNNGEIYSINLLYDFSSFFSFFSSSSFVHLSTFL